MFRVENADFIADKLASELLPNQEFREVVKNAEEAIVRRMTADGSAGGQIDLDVDWQMLEMTEGRAWYLSCADDGDGMTRAQLEKYTTTLAVEGAGKSQSLHQNQGMGLKISGPTRHKRGLLIRSLRAGEGTQVQIGWTGTEYNLIPLGPNGEVSTRVSSEMFPHFIRERGSGTVVTFLGNKDFDNTFVPEGKRRGWLLKYLNQRFFRLSHNDIEVHTRVPVGDVDDWPRTPEDARARSRKEGGRSFNRTKVDGTATVWDEAADKQGGGFRDFVELPGDPATGVPPARMHWWVLPKAGSDVSTRTYGGGSIGILFQNELHDWRTSGQANPFLARMGILFGKNRTTFVLEPQGPMITSDFARAHVLVSGKPVFETDAWFVWADQFRTDMPEAIKKVMLDEQAQLQTEDPDRARRIRDRLKDVMALLRPTRGRARPGGSVLAGGPPVTGPDTTGGDAFVQRETGGGRRSGAGAQRGIGALLSQTDVPDGTPAEEVFSILSLDCRWVTEAESDGFAIVHDNGRGLHDRAAALAGEDGVSANILMLNKEFRGYRAIVSAVSEWANPEGDDDKAQLIESATQEWVEQKMIEAVNGLRQLENGSSWITTDYDEALSPVALTAAFMADRFHTLREIKRQVGSIRRPEGAVAS